LTQDSEGATPPKRPEGGQRGKSSAHKTDGGKTLLEKVAEIRSGASNGTNYVHNMSADFIDDLKDLPHAQQELIRSVSYFKELSLVDEMRLQEWLITDKAFRRAWEKRRSATLKRYAFLVDDALVKAAMAGDKNLLKLYYQRTGLLPAGGEKVADDAGEPGEEAVSRDQLEAKIRELEEKLKTKGDPT